jgi:hypothetical protein
MHDTKLQEYRRLIMVPTGEFVSQGHLPSKLHGMLQDLIGHIEEQREQYVATPKPAPPPPKPAPKADDRDERPARRVRDEPEARKKK